MHGAERFCAHSTSRRGEARMCRLRLKPRPVSLNLSIRNHSDSVPIRRDVFKELMISESYWTNPQYFITLKEPDKSNENGLCVIIVALLQKNRREMVTLSLDKRHEKGYKRPKYLRIGFDLYRVCPPLSLRAMRWRGTDGLCPPSTTPQKAITRIAGPGKCSPSNKSSKKGKVPES